jgi:nuclear protein localization protein 4 homolog
VLSALAEIGAQDIHKGSEVHKRVELARWLSNWHLVAFLGTTQLFSPVRPTTQFFFVSQFSLNVPDSQEDMKILIRVASSPNLLADPSLLDPLFATDSWHTLITFTRETARTYL